MDAFALQAEVTRAWEVACVAEATCITAVLAAETSTQEAAMTWDSATICINNAEDLAALAEMEAQERVLRVEAENVVVLASAREGEEGLVRKIVVLEGELAVARQAQEVAEEKSCGLFDAVADAERRWEEFEKERREHFEELTLLQTRVSELSCHCRSSTGEESPIEGDVDRCPPPHREGQRACCASGEDVLYHGVGARTLARRDLPGGNCGQTSCRILEVGGAMLMACAAWREDGMPPGRARLADHLDEAAGWLGAELAARWEVDAELETM
jgi:hypothetical protein